MSLNQTLDASINFKSGFFPTSAPSTDADRWNFMNGLWTDGSSMFYGGNGYNAGTTTIPTKIIYPGDSDPTGIATGEPSSIMNGGNSMLVAGLQILRVIDEV